MYKQVANIIEQLGLIFDKFNETKFDGTLIKPVITVQSGQKQKAYGWCSVGHRWQDNEQNGYHEINISAEYINREIPEIAETMLHEMIHLWNQQNGIRDCSKQTGRHLKQFKDACDKFGLPVEKDSKGDWCITKLNDELIQLINTFGIDEGVFNVFRKEEVEQEPKQRKPRTPKLKYICSCGQEIESKVPVKVYCQQCDGEFELQN